MHEFHVPDDRSRIRLSECEERSILTFLSTAYETHRQRIAARAQRKPHFSWKSSDNDYSYFLLPASEGGKPDATVWSVVRFKKPELDGSQELKVFRLKPSEYVAVEMEVTDCGTPLAIRQSTDEIIMEEKKPTFRDIAEFCHAISDLIDDWE